MATDQQLTPLFKQYWDIKKQYPDVILLFRLGDFYEMFGQIAPECGGALISRARKGRQRAESGMSLVLSVTNGSPVWKGLSFSHPGHTLDAI